VSPDLIGKGNFLLPGIREIEIERKVEMQSGIEIKTKIEIGGVAEE
jgi:hypothetical protein